MDCGFLITDCRLPITLISNQQSSIINQSDGAQSPALPGSFLQADRGAAEDAAEPIEEQQVHAGGQNEAEAG